MTIRKRKENNEKVGKEEGRVKQKPENGISPTHSKAVLFINGNMQQDDIIPV